MKPSSSLVEKGEKCVGGKLSKERITVLVGANMEGAKLPLVVIGKSANPRCFKNKRIPVKYYTNKKAWMTGSLFASYLKELDDSMRAAQRKIAMILDNCPAHPHSLKYDNIALFFLPPNTTSHTQPMDAGVIRSLKCHYRRRFVENYLIALESKTEFTLSLLDSIQMLKRAWEDVTVATISNCFHHVSFNSHPQTELEVENMMPVEQTPAAADNIWDRLRIHGIGVGNNSFTDYVNSDAEVATTFTLTDENIIEDILEKKNDDSEEEDQQNGDEEPPVPEGENFYYTIVKHCSLLFYPFLSFSTFNS
jgi:hypothetical protein